MDVTLEQAAKISNLSTPKCMISWRLLYWEWDNCPELDKALGKLTTWLESSTGEFPFTNRDLEDIQSELFLHRRS